MSLKQLTALLAELSGRVSEVGQSVRRLEKAERQRSREATWPQAPALATLPRTSAELIAADKLPPRHGQVLAALLDGWAEKEIAFGMGLSPHTVHEYVKAIHRRYGVSARCELFSFWFRRAIGLLSPAPVPIAGSRADKASSFSSTIRPRRRSRPAGRGVATEPTFSRTTYQMSLPDQTPPSDDSVYVFEDR